MTTMTWSAAIVSSKGQITLPVALRRLLGLESGSRVRIGSRDQELVIQSELPMKAYRGVLKHLRGVDTRIPKEADRF